MWPKMLFELLPHVGRIVPMAERFLESRKAREQEEQAQLAAINETLRTELGRNSDTLRTELGKAAELTSGIDRAVREQAEQVSALTGETSRSRAALEALEGRIRTLEEKAGAEDSAAPRLQLLIVVALILLVVVVGLLVVLLLRGGGR